MDTSKILIVDDNPEIREIIEILLKGEGFETVQAKDGLTALNQLKKQDFDLIILDIMMPGMNGYQTCTKALLRRYHVYKGKTEILEPSKVISYHGLTIDEQTEQVTKDGVTIDLTNTEYRMLVLLIKHCGQVFSAEHLYESIWEEPYYYGANNTVMVHMRNLRRKIEENPNQPEIIKTVWGKGYRCD